MLSYCHGPSNVPLLAETIGACLDRVTASFEHRTALISRHQGIRYTYGGTRGYSVMLGYWNNPGATAEAIDQARWMHTGDLAVMRDDGYVAIVGRIKDIIIRGGENISPREIEDFLYTHPGIREVQVVGVPDARYGEEICAWIRLRDSATATAEEIRAYCRGQIATYKIPRYVRFTNDFPTTVTGKIQKFRMREISIEELGLKSGN